MKNDIPNLDQIVVTMSNTTAIAFYYDATRQLVVCNYANRVAGEGVTCDDALADAYRKWVIVNPPVPTGA